MAASPTLQWLLSLFLTLLLSSLYPSSSSMFTVAISDLYTRHCGSIVPKSSPTNLFGSSNSFHISNGNFFTSDGRLNQLLYPSYKSTTIYTTAKTFYFQPAKVHKTRDTSTLKIEGTLVLLGSWVPQNESSKLSVYEDGRRKVIFKLSGFWSESAGKLCMVGTGQIRPEGLSSSISAVLQLEYPKISNIKTSVVKGKIESLANLTSHFDPISLLAYSQKNYEYTLIDQAKESCSVLPHVGESAVAMESTTFCSTLQSISPGLSFYSSELMNFIGFDLISMSQVECLGDNRVHISMALSNETIYFYDGRPLIPEKSLVAEGVWDDHVNKLCILACKIISKDGSLTSSLVGDCSIGFSFWFPSTFSLKERNTIVGNMWNIKEINIKGYNKVIDLYSTDNRNLVVSELKYEYTELEAARKYCKMSNAKDNKKEYPNVKSFNDMIFSLRVRDTDGRSGRGSARQVSVGEIYYGNPNGHIVSRNYMYRATTEPYNLHTNLVDHDSTIQNVGYMIDYAFRGDNANKRVSADIWAEGIYNSNTGMLCLMGCILPYYMNIYARLEGTKAHANANDRDCEVFMQLQLAPVTQNANVEENGKGMIKSTRDPSDPLYFHPIEIISSPMSRLYSSEEFGRINLELVMVAISLTLICIFTYLQLRHARKHSKIRPMMSRAMLIILTLGHMIPLILNIEDLLASQQHHFFLQSGGWPDTENAIMRFITLIAVFIQIRVLRLRWKSRSIGGISPHGAIWKAEMASLLLCVPVYLSGATIAWFFHSNISKFNRTSWEDLTRFSGLVFDSFLLPQIVFNVFFNTKEKILSPFFYGGITAVRVAPHMYNAYRASRFFGNIDSSYIYASHDDDYYSAILDVVIPCGGFLSVVLIYVQQRFGGRCFLPTRFKQGQGYELVPQESNNIEF
ncbi:hypothetical protein LUZ60_005998 [Juncus effusus]|nr:hypothetical protein LUZ60_005998 [Juncus effusus]